MRILIDSGEHEFAEKGRLARIEVALRRLRELWPDAEIGLLTDQLTQAGLFFPDVTPVPCSGQRGWPDGVNAGLLKADAPKHGLDGTSLDVAPSLRGSFDRSPQSAPRGVADADLVVCAGGTDLTDFSPEDVARTLSILEVAQRVGARTAMFAQSFGPFERPDLVARAAEILPKVDLITVREDIRSPRVLGLLGVQASRMSITGDDALGLVSADPTGAAGVDLGINLRIDDYQQLESVKAGVLSTSVRQIAGDMVAHLSPIYSSERSDEDRLGTLKLVGDYPLVRTDYSRFATPREVADRVAQCRVVVTGSYEVAVLALSQGVAAVCLPRSDYNLNGFDGLKVQFPLGCRIIPLSTPRLGDALVHEISSMWAQSLNIRKDLIETTARLTAMGEAACRRLHANTEGTRESEAA